MLYKQSLSHAHKRACAHINFKFTMKNRPKGCQPDGFLILTINTPIASPPTLEGCISYEETTIYILLR